MLLFDEPCQRRIREAAFAGLAGRIEPAAGPVGATLRA